MDDVQGRYWKCIAWGGRLFVAIDMFVMHRDCCLIATPVLVRTLSPAYRGGRSEWGSSAVAERVSERPAEARD